MRNAAQRMRIRHSLSSRLMADSSLSLVKQKLLLNSLTVEGSLICIILPFQPFYSHFSTLTRLKPLPFGPYSPYNPFLP